MDILTAIIAFLGVKWIIFMVISFLLVVVAVCTDKERGILLKVGDIILCTLGYWMIGYIVVAGGSLFIEYINTPAPDEGKIQTLKVLSARGHKEVFVKPLPTADATECPGLYDIPYHFKSVVGEKESYGIVCYNTYWHEVRVVKER